MPDLLSLSARIIDSGVADEPVNRITQELSEIVPGLAIIESFSHSVALATEDGLIVFDASGRTTGPQVVSSLRTWSEAPIRTIVYTHGHLDHVGGSPAFVADSIARGHPTPSFVSHEAVLDRFRRYRLTDGWNRRINQRQFGWIRNPAMRVTGDESGSFLPDDVAEPDTTFKQNYRLEVGGVEVLLRHGKGETDDHAWAWIPSMRAICCGDFLIWNFPNAGNPQKVQRYPAEWAKALREMASLEPELLVPAHGLPIGGRERIQTVIEEVAGALEQLVSRTLEMMNSGATLDDIVLNVRLPDETLARPFLRPLYDEPEFVVRNIWRLYGGWWDGNPAHLKPPADRDLAREVAALAGGAAELAKRAEALAETGRLDLACQLAEWAVQADPADTEAHSIRHDVYRRRYSSASSLIAKGIFASAANDSLRRSAGSVTPES